MLFSWLDVAVLVMVGAFVFAGWKNGLVKTGFRVLSFGASLILAWILHPYLSGILQNTPLYENLFSSAAESAGVQTGVTPAGLQSILSQGSLAVAEYFAKFMLNVISFFVILLLAKIALFFAGKILHFVASLPVIGFFNRLGGMAVGFLEGFLVVCIVLAVMYVTPPLRNHKPLGYAIEQSVVTRTLYIHNPILNILTPKMEKEVLDHEKME